MRTLFRGGCIIYGDRREKKDILVEGEKIIKIEAGIEDADAEVIDATGRLLFPGFIDAHTHFDLEVSGTVTADDFASGTKAAVSGGTTTIIDFATQNRGETLQSAFRKWNRKAEGKSSCDYGFHMAISDWNSKVEKEIDEMSSCGISSYKLYMTYEDMYLNDGEIYRALCRIGETKGLVGVHCENRELIAALVEGEKEKGHVGPAAHAAARPEQAEAEAVNRLLELASVADVPVMVVHLSTERGLRVVNGARRQGQKVYAETCPQYLLLHEDKYSLPDPMGLQYMIAPPLRRERDSAALWKALEEEQIQTVATDHCSFKLKQKEAGRSDFTAVPCGMPGVETRPSLIYTYGVRSGRLTEEQMCACLAERAARLYGMYPQKGALLPGSDADIVVWNPLRKQILKAETQWSKADYHPYEGMEVYGLAEKVYLRGQLIASEGQLVQEEKGRYLFRNKPEFL